MNPVIFPLLSCLAALCIFMIDSYKNYQLEVPFDHELPKTLHPQSDITIHGVLENKVNRFAINLLVPQDVEDDIAFHFNPRLDQLYTARNSWVNGKWGQEEGNSHYKFPFKRDQPFLVEIFFTHSEFLVAVNGIHYCAYTYRTSIVNITRLQVWGAVKLYQVHITNRSSYPSRPPDDCPSNPYTLPLNQGITKNVSEITPIYGLMQQNLQKGSKIEIKGRVKLLPYTFYVNLQEGSHTWPHPDIPLHISVRFCQGGEQVTLANAWFLQGWGREVYSQTKFLFTPGYPFTMKIECAEEGFIARVDNQLLLAFKHRMPYSIIDTLHIQGDVFIFDINIR